MAPVAAVAAALAAGYYLNGKYQITKDLVLVRVGLQARKRFEALVKNRDCSLYNRFEEQCQIRPFSVALVFENTSYTWRDLELASNRMAHWFVAQGIQKKQRVAMMMHNSPMFIITWLALLKIMVVPAFINNQIAGPVLVHSLKVADAKFLLFDYELAPAIQESLKEIKDLGYNIFTVTPKDQVLGQRYAHLPEDARQVLDEAPSFFGYVEWKHLSTEGFPKESRHEVMVSDPAALIYTSGTTGFPKAAIMDHGRCNMASYSYGSLCDIKPENKYIGELCRYLLNAPETPLDKRHKVRMAFGNGMRPDVWAKFQERFNIPTIFEYYTMSEGTAALMNISKNKRDQGAVGFRGPIIRSLQPGFKLVKVDFDTEELIRDKKTGLCILCQPGEIGELVTLADNKTAASRYAGYFNQPEISKAKLVQNVMEKDDIYFRTGDLLFSKDQYWYFADRAGDTYRWKGENVSTAEIADTIGRVAGVTSCTVYGVSVPGMDGRAGMATLVLKDSIVQVAGEGRAKCHVDEAALDAFLSDLSKDVVKKLPAYAIPRFLRIAEQELETTGTFKNKKVELKKEGFDLNKVKERLYWWTPKGEYAPFGVAENDQILTGRARL
ncbi:hypothetical protein BGZ75_001411 [Mortierella antarctica]|nr:hypothetical protein BGZ75_001411 [Mortierella antarctica]